MTRSTVLQFPTPEQRAVDDLQAAIERAAAVLSASHLYSVVAAAVAQHARGAQ